MGFFSNRREELTQALAAVDAGDKSAIDSYAKLVQHTIAEAGGKTEEEAAAALLRALKGQD